MELNNVVGGVRELWLIPCLSRRWVAIETIGGVARRHDVYRELM